MVHQSGNTMASLNFSPTNCKAIVVKNEPVISYVACMLLHSHLTQFPVHINPPSAISQLSDKAAILK